ncbi:unnamed protein product [Ectocarpus sp. CCAP 1310/34]|nr:unnamed protein product [Ectocarpus sp. CCAP 1310/34]
MLKMAEMWPINPATAWRRPMKRGGIIGWGSYLTFAWAGSFLKLGSTVTLKEEHLEGIYDKHERWEEGPNMLNERVSRRLPPPRWSKERFP